MLPFDLFVILILKCFTLFSVAPLYLLLIFINLGILARYKLLLLLLLLLLTVE